MKKRKDRTSFIQQYLYFIHTLKSWYYIDWLNSGFVRSNLSFFIRVRLFTDNVNILDVKSVDVNMSLGLTLAQMPSGSGSVVGYYEYSRIEIMKCSFTENKEQPINMFIDEAFWVFAIKGTK